MMQIGKALEEAHRLAAAVVRPGDRVVDATAGNGHDAAFLAGLVGDGGLVEAFDIQETAIESTRRRLEEKGLLARCRLHHEGHEWLEEMVDGPIRLALYNLGFLPGGDHRLYTKAETTIRSLEGAMRLLEPDGLILVVVYHGGDSGYEERDALLEYVARIDPKYWRVQLRRMINWPNDPPFLIAIAHDR